MLRYFSCGHYGCDCCTPQGPQSFSGVNPISMHRSAQELACECGHCCQRQDKCSHKAKGKKIRMDFLPVIRPASTKWLISENSIPSCQHFPSSCKCGGSRASHQLTVCLRQKEQVPAGTKQMSLHLLQHNPYFRGRAPTSFPLQHSLNPAGFP